MFEKLDKIIVTEKDYEKIHEWNLERIKNVENDNDDSLVGFPMEEGVLILEQFVKSVKGIEVNQLMRQATYFKVNEGEGNFTINMSLYDMQDWSILLSFIVVASDNEINFDIVENNVKGVTKQDVDNSMKQSVLLLTDTFRYMVNVPQEVIEKDEIRNVSKKTKSTKKKKNNNKIVKIVTKKYVFTHSNKDYVKNNYERHKESWSVRGHWRFYKKTGKKVWVKPHVKGNIEEVEGKTYKF